MLWRVTRGNASCVANFNVVMTDARGGHAEISSPPVGPRWWRNDRWWRQCITWWISLTKRKKLFAFFTLTLTLTLWISLPLASYQRNNDDVKIHVHFGTLHWAKPANSAVLSWNARSLPISLLGSLSYLLTGKQLSCQWFHTHWHW